ncbi:MAG: OsmC family protein [Colwellia sp.]|nr:OsmC family protein [Colwellia sp.]
MPDINFSVVGYSQSPTRMSVKARNFTMIVDEPPALGGQDEGPNPVEYVLSAIVGCLNVTGYIVAKEMGLTINSLEIKANGDINPDLLFGTTTNDRAGYKGINIDFCIDAQADQETLDSWLSQVKARCPVSDNLANATPIKIGLNIVELA